MTCVRGAADRIQCFWDAKQALYQLSYTSSSWSLLFLMCRCFIDRFDLARPTCHTWLMTVPGASVDVLWAGYPGEEPNEGSVRVSVSIQLVVRPQVYQHPVWPQFPHLRNVWVASTIFKQYDIKSWGVE